MTRVFACRTNLALSSSDAAVLSTVLSAERLERSRRFVRPKDQVRSILAGALVPYAVSGATTTDAPVIRLANDDYGRPFIHDLPNLHVSISHSGSWVVCSVSDRPVGVDVEQRCDGPNMHVASGFFAPGERAYLAKASSEDDRKIRFYAIWTAKESYTKAVGLGLGLDLRSFNTRGFGETGLVLDRHGMTTGFFTRSVCIDAEHACTLCTLHGENHVRTQYLSDRSLVDHFRQNGSCDASRSHCGA